MKKISVIVPCYNEQEAIPFFYDEIVKISKIMEMMLNLNICLLMTAQKIKQ